MADIDPLNADFARQDPDTFAAVLGRGETQEIIVVLSGLPPGLAGSIVSRLPASRIGVLWAAGQDSQERWLAEAPFNDAKALLSRIPREQCLALVNSLKGRDRRRNLLQYLKYPAHSVGALVSDVPLRITAETPAADVLAELRTLPPDDPGPLVVVQADGNYLGQLDLWKLVTGNPPAGPIRDYTSPTPTLHPETSLASAAEDQNWQVHNWLPVVDHEQRILGSVSRASVFRTAGHHVDRRRPGQDFITVLVADVVRLFGNVLDSLLKKRGTS